MSAAQYLERERAAADKHELWQGEASAMAGASLVHNQIVGNLARALGNLLADGPCLVLISQDRARIEHYERQAEDRWLLRELGPGASVSLRSIGTALPVDEVYRKVAL